MIFSISQGQITISLLPAKIAPLLMSGVKRAFPSLPEFPTRRAPSSFTRASRRQSRHQTQIDCRIDWTPKSEFPTRARNSTTSGRAQEPIIACFSKYLHQINDKSPSDPANISVINPRGNVMENWPKRGASYGHRK